MKSITPEMIRDIVSRDVDALYQIMDAIEKAEPLLNETRDAIMSEECDSFIIKSQSYLSEVMQNIKCITDYCRSLEDCCSMYLVYASPDEDTIIHR